MANGAIGAISAIDPNKFSKIIPINSNSNQISGLTGTQGTGDVSFSDYLKNAISDVNNLQTESAAASQKLATGEVDIHTATIAAEKADLALQFTLAIRNKIFDAYSEIMRMQV